MSDLVDELVAEAKAAKRAEAAYQRHLKRVRELLPEVRVKENLGPLELEAKILKVYDRGTISRLTAKAAGTSKKGQDMPKPPEVTSTPDGG